MSATDVYALVGGAPPATPGGLWDGLRDRLDPARYRPALADHVEIRLFPLRWGNDYVMVANTRDLVHYRLPASQLPLLQAMDGTRTVKQIVVEELGSSGDLDLDSVTDLVRTLQEGNFLADGYRDVDAAVGRAMAAESAGRRRFRTFAKTLMIEWRSANAVVEWLYHHGLRHAFLRPVIVVQAIVAVVGVVVFARLVASGDFTIGGASLAASFAILWILDYVSVLIHELGHALVVIRHGRRIKSAGFMIYFGSPAFFVDGSDGLMMDRRAQIASSFAGPFAEMILASVCSLIAWWFPEWWLSQTLFVAAALNYYLILMNLIPMLELDGYFILADVIQVPDLRPRSLAFVRDDLLRKLIHRERFSRAEVGLALYGVLGIAFTVFALYSSYRYWKTLFGPLVERLWEGGTSTRVLLAALVLIVIGPVVRGAIALGRSIARRVLALARRIRFRLETSWRVEAAELIDALPMFDDVPVEVLNDLAGRIRLRTLAHGRPVFRQGDRPDAFYVVRKGLVEIVEEDPQTGAERQIRVVGRGESFGELGLLLGSPRAATVRALGESEVFEVDRGTFERLLADMAAVPDFAPTLQQLAELRALPAFSNVPTDQLVQVLEGGAWLTVAPDEAVIRQGEVGDAFYAVSSGRFEVLRDDAVVDTLGPGASFGEIALLQHVPRTATVIARTPARVFRLERAAFDAVLAASFRRDGAGAAVADQMMTH